MKLVHDELNCLLFGKVGVEQIDELSIRTHQEYKRGMIDVVAVSFSLDLVCVNFELFGDVLEVLVVLVPSSEADEGSIKETKVPLDCLRLISFGVD